MTLSDERNFFFRKIRQKERPLCSFSIDDDALPVDDPLEVEYQMLKVYRIIV